MNEAIFQRRIALKKKLKNRELVFAGWSSLSHPSIAEFFTEMNVDFTSIDLEHTTISLEQAQRLIEISQGRGCLCLPRITSHNPDMIKRLLDTGADGLIVPMVNTPAEVERLIEWTQFPPQGKRSYGVARGQGYGFDFAEYTQNWNSSSSLIIQIESTLAIENIEKLLRYPEVDGAMIGPYDISGSMGIPGQIDHPKIREACKHVAKVCKSLGKSYGTQVVEPTAERIKDVLEQDYTFIVMGSDIFVLWKWAEKMRGLIGEFRPRA